jgi:hypothetical protein
MLPETIGSISVPNGNIILPLTTTMIAGWGSVTEAVVRGKLACKYYKTKISAFMMIWDSDCSSLLKSSDKKWSWNYGAKIMCLSSFFIH